MRRATGEKVELIRLVEVPPGLVLGGEQPPRRATILVGVQDAGLTAALFCAPPTTLNLAKVAHSSHKTLFDKDVE